MNHPRSRQGGGMISLLLTLVVIGVLAYFALHSFSAPQPAITSGPASPGSQQQMVACTKLIGDLVSHTGGIGPTYKAGYETLPASCRALAPPPPPGPAAADAQETQGQ